MLDTTLLKISELNNEVKTDLRNVKFDANEHRGVISMTKLKWERSVRFQNLYGSGSSQVLDMEYHGKEVVGITCEDRVC